MTGIRLVLGLLALTASHPAAAEICAFTQGEAIATTDEHVRIETRKMYTNGTLTPPVYVIDPQTGKVATATGTPKPPRDAVQDCHGTTCSKLKVDATIGKLALDSVTADRGGRTVVALYGEGYIGGTQTRLAAFDPTGKRLATWASGRGCVPEHWGVVVGTVAVDVCTHKNVVHVGGSPLILRDTATGAELARIKARISSAMLAYSDTLLIILDYDAKAFFAYDLTKPKKPVVKWKLSMADFSSPKLLRAGNRLVAVDSSGTWNAAVIDADTGTYLHKLVVPACPPS